MPDVAVRLIWPIATVVAGAVALPILVVVAAVEGVRTRRRRARRQRPRLLWGPSPVIAIRDWSRAMRTLGFESITLANHVPPINAREDFDVHRDQFLHGVPRADVARDFFMFVWAIRRAEVFFWYFEGGHLKRTTLRRLEPWLLRLAGKKIIVFPYGGDIAVLGELGVAEEPLLRDYPELAAASERTRRRVLHLCRWADLVIRNYQYGFLPRADVFWPTQIAIDVDQWSPAPSPSGRDARTDEVVVVHAPNHRHIKGTQALMGAVEQLQAEGLNIRLELLERRPNEEVRAAVRSSDIVADQFIAGYALFAIEGMSTGKPVMSALSWMPAELRGSPALRACPIVDTDVSNLAQNLRALATDPERRVELGRAGREYVLTYHAYLPVARTWAALVDHVWWGSPLPAELLPVPDLTNHTGIGTRSSSTRRAIARGS